ncbi:MAG TPA: hypothetical protein VLQ91_22080, partial [Draconibacterium sp.]|nr:hypothetical protein [Draconibacterium sp.]
PSVPSGNTTTNWELEMRCLPATTQFDTSIFAVSNKEWDIDTLAFTFNSTLCRFELRMSIPLFQGVPTNLNIYCGINQASGNWPIIENGIAGVYLPYDTTPYFTFTGLQGTILSHSDIITTTKNGNTITMQFSDSARCTTIMDGYNALMATGFGTNWINDDTSYKYYRQILFTLYYAPVNCGDGQTYRNLNILKSWPVVKTDANTITITTSAVTNNCIDYPVCNKLKTQQVNNIVISCTATHNLADFTETTKCSLSNFLGQGQSIETESKVPTVESSGSRSYFCWWKNTIPYSSNGWCNQSNNYALWTHYNLKIKITATRNPDGTWIQDPLENFEIYELINPSTECVDYAYQLLVYKKLNGVVTVKKYWRE